jgi:hypothetical protein
MSFKKFTEAIDIIQHARCFWNQERFLNIMNVDKLWFNKRECAKAYKDFQERTLMFLSQLDVAYQEHFFVEAKKSLAALEASA